MTWLLGLPWLMPQVDTGGVAAWVVVLLGGGGAASVLTLVKAYRLWASGAETKEAAAIANLERWRIDADKRAADCLRALNIERQWTAWYDRRVAHLERTLITNGIDPPAPSPEPPVRP